MLGSAVSAWQPERVPDLVQTTRLFWVPPCCIS